MKTFITHSNTETQKLAEKLAKWIRQAHHCNVVALSGDLGAGKTTFAQGFAKGLGIKDKIISPTFVLIRQHMNLPAGRQVFYHVDLYRIESFKELGLEELFSDKNNIVLIEWAEKIKNLIPKNAIWITFKMLSENKREITLS